MVPEEILWGVARPSANGTFLPFRHDVALFFAAKDSYTLRYSMSGTTLFHTVWSI
jgi:hypothetical protein